MSKNENLLTEAQVRQFMKLANLEPLTPGFVHGLHEGDGAADDPEWSSTYKGKTDTAKVSDDPKAHRIHVDKKKSKAQLPKHMQDTFADADKGISDLLSGEEGQAGKKQEESHARGRGEGAAGYGHPNEGDRAGARLREQELDDFEDAEADLGAPEDLELGELGAEEELDDAALDLEGDAGSMVSVDDFLAALEVALEDVLGDEVEVDQEEEEELEGPLGPGEELDVDVEEEELGLQERRGGRRPRRTNEGAALQGMVNTITRRVAKRIVREALKNKR
jgi:hypothetical protein